MAKRKYTTTTIDGKTYELHGVKVNTGEKDDKGNKIMADVGYAPVRVYTVDDYREHVASTTDGEIELMISDTAYGEGVRLQRMVRELTAPDTDRKTPSDADRARIGSQFTADELVHYAGKYAAMQLEIERRWQLERDNAEPVDLSEYKDKIWTELL
jgi:hypothetical protein